MLDFDKFLNFIKSQDFYDDQIAHIQHFPKKEAEFGELSKPLKKRLQMWLSSNNIRLWSHQAQAINSIREKNNTVIVTSTASGKSLCYNISVLESILNDETTTALYIFPTKALARDQFIVLSDLMTQCKIKRTRLGIYDGDIDPAEKRLVLDSANIVITNPYGLHFYLPWFKQKWGRICKYLKYIVLDEIHVYRGIFGSNFAQLIRRLKRILEMYKVNPIWVLSSATINNAKAFAEKLVGEKFNLVDDDSSPSGAKEVLLWDLPYDEHSNKYRSPHQESKNIFISHLKHGIQTLMFTLSRRMAELQAIWTRDALPNLREQIVSYRAGISKKRRREIETDFKSNRILGISSTNALELGIDIGSLEATITSGFPGTISSFKQQIGRSGRGEDYSISTYIPMPDPLDLFYIHNPDILFGPIQEEILITLRNKNILKNHFCCAAKEIPLTVDEFSKFGLQDKNAFKELLKELVVESLLMKRGVKYYWRGKFFPNEQYGLNDLSSRSYKLLLRTETKDQLLTTEDESFVFRDLHPGAVYLYEAESYIVEELDLERKEVYISRANVDYYTQSLKHTDITPIEVIHEKEIGLDNVIKVFFGKVKVEHEYYSYKVIDTMTQEIRARKLLEDIPIIEFETESVYFLIPYEYQRDLELGGYDLGGTIHAVEHALIAISPALAQISRWDLGGVSIDFDPVKQQPIIYIYDGFRGGVGISETLYHNFNSLLKLGFDLINTCKCDANITPRGCPACTLSPRCGNQNTPLDKKGALYLLNRLLGNV